MYKQFDQLFLEGFLSNHVLLITLRDISNPNIIIIIIGNDFFIKTLKKNLTCIYTGPVNTVVTNFFEIDQVVFSLVLRTEKRFDKN